MKNPYQWLADAINNHTWAVAGVAGAIFILALFGLSMVTMETGDDTYIDKNGVLFPGGQNTEGENSLTVQTGAKIEIITESTRMRPE